MGIRTLLPATGLLGLLSSIALTQEVEPSVNRSLPVHTVVQSGHLGMAGLLAFDPTGTWLAAASKLSPEVTVWHVPTRTLMAKMRSSRNYVYMPNRLEFLQSPLAVHLSSANAAEIWQLPDLQYNRLEINRPQFQPKPADEGPGATLIDTPQGLFAAAAITRSRQWQALCRIDNGRVGASVLSLDGQINHSIPMFSLPYWFAFSNDEQKVAVVNPTYVRVVDFKQGKLLQDIKAAPSTFHTAEFSPAGNYLSVNAHTDKGEAVTYVYSVETGRQVLIQKATPFVPLCFLSDDSAFIEGRPEDTGTVIWRTVLETDESTKLFSVPQQTTAMAVHEASGLLALTTSDFFGLPSITLFDVKSGVPVGELRNYIQPVGTLLVDTAQKSLIETGISETCQWQLSTGRRRRCGQTRSGPVVAAHAGKLVRWSESSIFSDRRWLTVTELDGTGDVAVENELIRIDVCEDRIGDQYPIAVSDDLAFAAVGDGTNFVVCDIAAKALTRFERDIDDGAKVGQISILAVSGDGRRVLVADTEGRLERWSVPDAKREFSVQKSQYKSSVFLESSSVRSIVAIDDDFVFAGEFGIQRLKIDGTVDLIQTLTACDELARSPNGSLLAWLDLPMHVIQICDARELSATSVKSVPVSAASVLSLRFGPDDNELFIVTSDGVIQLWRLDQARLEATFAASRSGGYVISTPDGYYKSSRDTLKAVAFRSANEMYLADQFDVRSNRPDLVLKRLGYSSPETLDAYRKVTRWRQQQNDQFEDTDDLKVRSAPAVRFARRPASVSDDKNLELSVEVTPGSSPVRSVAVIINQVPVVRVHSDKLNEGLEPQTISVSVELLSGKNRIDVQAESTDGLRSRKATQIVNCLAPVEERNTWFIGIGVSEYQDTTNNLNFAAKDAVDLSSTFESLTTATFHTLLVTNQDATSANVLTRVAEFLLKSSPQDTVILFLAGHGLIHDGEYRFAMHDCDFEAPSAGSVTFATIERLLRTAHARHRVVLIDSCHAGDSLPGSAAAGPPADAPRATLRIRGASLMHDRVDDSGPSLRKLLLESFSGVLSDSGAVVITASDASQYALESKAWKNGAFTYVVREGLAARKADLNADGKVTAGELSEYVATRVAELTSGVQTPQRKRENLEFDPVVAEW